MPGRLKSVNVTVVQARGLTAADWGSKSDPFCKVTIGDITHETKYINKTLEPVWNETFRFPASVNDTVIFEVFDKDVLSSDFLGSCTVSIQKMDLKEDTETEHWLPLVDKKMKGVGDLLVTFVPEFETVVDSNSRSEIITITVIAGEDLPKMDTFGKSDPFVILKIGSVEKRTTTKNNTLTPEWNEKFTFTIHESDVLQIICEDKDSFSSDLIGQSNVSGQDILSQIGNEVLVPLFKNEKPAGQLLLFFEPGEIDGDIIVNNTTDQDSKNLVIRLVGANHLPQDKSGSPPSPYVQMILGNKKYSTTTKKSTLNPVWDEDFHFDVTSHGILEMTVFNKGMLTSSLMGQTTIQGDRLISAAKLESYLETPLIDPKTQVSTGAVVLQVFDAAYPIPPPASSANIEQNKKMDDETQKTSAYEQSEQNKVVTQVNKPPETVPSSSTANVEAAATTGDNMNRMVDPMSAGNMNNLMMNTMSGGNMNNLMMNTMSGGNMNPMNTMFGGNMNRMMNPMLGGNMNLMMNQMFGGNMNPMINPMFGGNMNPMMNPMFREKIFNFHIRIISVENLLVGPPADVYVTLAVFDNVQRTSSMCPPYIWNENIDCAAAVADFIAVQVCGDIPELDDPVLGQAVIAAEQFLQTAFSGQHLEVVLRNSNGQVNGVLYLAVDATPVSTMPFSRFSLPASIQQPAPYPLRCEYEQVPPSYPRFSVQPPLPVRPPVPYPLSAHPIEQPRYPRYPIDNQFGAVEIPPRIKPEAHHHHHPEPYITPILQHPRVQTYESIFPPDQEMFTLYDVNVDGPLDHRPYTDLNIMREPQDAFIHEPRSLYVPRSYSLPEYQTHNEIQHPIEHSRLPMEPPMGGEIRRYIGNRRVVSRKEVGAPTRRIISERVVA